MLFQLGKVNFEEVLSKIVNKMFFSNINVFMLWEGFIDQESGIRVCNVLVFDGVGKVLFIILFNVFLGNFMIFGNIMFYCGEYIVYVKCINNVGFFFMFFVLFVIDNILFFLKGFIVVGVLFYGFFQYQFDNILIIVLWFLFVDDESNVESYFCVIGSELYKDDIIFFKNVRLVIELMEMNFRLFYGEIYFIIVIL